MDRAAAIPIAPPTVAATPIIAPEYASNLLRYAIMKNGIIIILVKTCIVL